jgi:hypothetical protein
MNENGEPKTETLKENGNQTLKVEPPPRKMRSDAKLWLLSEDKQAEIIELLQKTSLKDSKELLAREGIETSVSALSEFRTRYLMVKRIEEMEAAREVVETRKLGRQNEEPPLLTKAEMFDFGQDQFAAQALLNGNVMEWQRMQKLRQAQEWIELERRRVALEEKGVNERVAAELEARRPLTPEEKRERIKQIFGIT